MPATFNFWISYNANQWCQMLWQFWAKLPLECLNVGKICQKKKPLGFWDLEKPGDLKSIKSRFGPREQSPRNLRSFKMLPLHFWREKKRKLRSVIFSVPHEFKFARRCKKCLPSSEIHAINIFFAENVARFEQLFYSSPLENVIALTYLSAQCISSRISTCQQIKKLQNNIH